MTHIFSVVAADSEKWKRIPFSSFFYSRIIFSVRSLFLLTNWFCNWNFIIKTFIIITLVCIRDACNWIYLTFAWLSVKNLNSIVTRFEYGTFFNHELQTTDTVTHQFLIHLQINTHLIFVWVTKGGKLIANSWHWNVVEHHSIITRGEKSGAVSLFLAYRCWCRDTPLIGNYFI